MVRDLTGSMTPELEALAGQEVRHVAQTHRFGCMVAVAAMIWRTDYETARRALAGDADDLDTEGMGYFILDSQLADKGYAVGRKWQTVQPGNRKREVWPPYPWADLHWCEVITHANTVHAILMLSDGRVLDPATPETRSLSDYAKVNFVAAVVPVRTPTQNHKGPYDE